MMLQLLHYPLAFAQPRRVTAPLTWAEHIPFGFAVIQCHQPLLLVELGTHTGVSYSAFCQAVDCLALRTKCYAVDTWEGDELAGFYGEKVFQEFSKYHDENYGSFSNLMRMKFDEAIPYFTDGSIDLLHIDGCHYYESVQHDFETWLPKMSERGVILFHDTFVKERRFGIGFLLEELQSRYPVFEFTHSYGLGVVAVGHKVKEEPLWELFQAGPKETVVIRRFFSTLGSGIKMRGELAEQRALLAARQAQILEIQENQRALENSLSWRLTKPLRRLRSALKR
jgi:hypothetical protein